MVRRNLREKTGLRGFFWPLKSNILRKQGITAKSNQLELEKDMQWLALLHTNECKKLEKNWLSNVSWSSYYKPKKLEQKKNAVRLSYS